MIESNSPETILMLIWERNLTLIEVSDFGGEDLDIIQDILNSFEEPCPIGNQVDLIMCDSLLAFNYLKEGALDLLLL